MYNSWTDVGGIVLLLPGSPFFDLDHYKREFTAMTPDINSVAGKGPEGPFYNMMIEFLRGIVVARPKSVRKPGPGRDERSFGISRGSTHEVAPCLRPDSGGLLYMI